MNKKEIQRIDSYVLLSNNTQVKETCCKCGGIAEPQIPCDIFYKDFRGVLCEKCIKENADCALIMNRNFEIDEFCIEEERKANAKKIGYVIHENRGIDYFMVIEMIRSMEPNEILDVYNSIDDGCQERMLEWMDELDAQFGDGMKEELLQSLKQRLPKYCDKAELTGKFITDDNGKTWKLFLQTHIEDNGYGNKDLSSTNLEGMKFVVKE